MKLNYESLQKKHINLPHRAPYWLVNNILRVLTGANGRYLLYINDNLNKTVSAAPQPFREQLLRQATNAIGMSYSYLKSYLFGREQQKPPTAPKDELQVIVRFQFNWNIYKGKATKEVKAMFAL